MATTVEWAREEFAGAALGDGRRVDRLVAMAAAAAERPAGRVSEVFADAAARQGAYDFLESGQGSGAIGQATADATIRRAHELDYIVVPVDGTSLNLTDRAQVKGFGSIGARDRGARGLKLIDAIALSPTGVPVGLLSMQWWSRPLEASTVSLSVRPREEKETQHWLDAIDDVSDLLARKAPELRAWLHFDREGDSQHVLEKLVSSGHWFTVRSNFDRRIHLGGRLRPKRNQRDCSERSYLRQHLRKQRILGEYPLDIPASEERPARRATMTVRSATVVVRLEDRKTMRCRTINLNAVWAKEQRGPKRQSRSGCTQQASLDWLLLTNRPVKTLKAARHVLSTYALRWRIEDFHKTWKTGLCNVEDTQLRSPEAVKKWATMLAAIAMRAERLKHLSRESPELPATDAFSASELQALVLLKRKYAARNEMVDDKPSLATAVRWMADLGGYTGKSSGGPPGTITISRGLERVLMAAEGIELASEQKKPKQKR
jgi:hypothetical protein